MLLVVVGGGVVWRCCNVQRGDVTVVIVQSTTLNTDITSYEALPVITDSVHPLINIHFVQYQSTTPLNIYISPPRRWATLLSDSHYNFIQNFDRLQHLEIFALKYLHCMNGHLCTSMLAICANLLTKLIDMCCILTFITYYTMNYYLIICLPTEVS